VKPATANAIAVALFIVAAVWLLRSPAQAVLPGMISAVAVGAIIGRWWSVWLALILLVLALPFNEQDPDGGVLIQYVLLLEVPAAAILIGVGCAGRKLFDRAHNEPTTPNVRL
jgi:hypothetical protein